VTLRIGSDRNIAIVHHPNYGRMHLPQFFAIRGKTSTFPASISKIAPAQAKFLLESQNSGHLRRSFVRPLTLGPPPGLLCPLYGNRRHVPAFLEDLNHD
jgi:hypothetical protein